MRTSTIESWVRLWSIEIEHRMADLVMDRVELIDADDVHAVLRAELRAPRSPCRFRLRRL